MTLTPAPRPPPARQYDCGFEDDQARVHRAARARVGDAMLAGD
jgi:hypothetical protein